MRGTARSSLILLLACTVLGGSRPAFAASRSLEVLHAFTAAGGQPMGNLVRDSNGVLYGTTRRDGISLGSVYSLTPDGSGGFIQKTLHVLAVDEGWYPEAGLTLAADGLLYGTTSAGSGLVTGTVFRIGTDGTGFTVLHAFAVAEGFEASAPLLEGGDGFFYGTCRFGGDTNNGTLFRIDAAGQYTRLHTFDGANGSEPFGRLYRDGAGNLYGTTARGGASAAGTIFELTSGGSFSVLHVFAGADGAWPTGGLTLGGDGHFYGTTRFGGLSGNGTVFRFTLPSTAETIHVFSGGDGDQPIGDLVVDANGKLVGATYDGGGADFGTVFRITIGGIFETLHEFSNSDGKFPWGGVETDASGHVYAAAGQGGRTNTGTVVAIDALGSETVLHTFLAGGIFPSSPLLSASDGLLYGTTSDGAEGTAILFQVDGAGDLHPFAVALSLRPWSLVESDDGWFYGTTQIGLAGNLFGAVFRAKLDGTFDAFHEFTVEEGTQPEAGLTRASDGNYYGTTSSQGPNGSGGSFFQVDHTNNAVTILHGFDGITNPPCGRLVETSPNVFHASAIAGGTAGDGVLMRLESSGDTTVIHSFDPAVDQGVGPCGDLAYATDGFLYGTTYYANDGIGTIFRASLSGEVTTLHVFQEADGEPPLGISQGSDGALYGVTPYAGAHNAGSLFRLDAAGKYDNLYAFDGLTGSQPLATLVSHIDGFLYGTAQQGGWGWGTLFRLSTTAPGATVSPTSGPADAAIPIALTGSRFQSDASIRIGGVTATDVDVPTSGTATATTPILTPGTLNHVLLLNPDRSSTTVIDGWLADFLDVPPDDPFHPAVETLLRNHITAGYGDGRFGRDDSISRAQMAVFVLKGVRGSGFHPPHCQGIFADVPCSNGFADWVEELYREGITAGCDDDPLSFCPDENVTRAQSAVFLLRGEHGSNYTPPPCTGLFDDVSCPDGFAVDWIEQFFLEGITAGCQPGLFCPDDPTTRAQMAVFVGAAFHLTP